MSPEKDVPRKGWWHARFRIDWPDRSIPPEWHVDLILAHRLTLPIIQTYQDKLSLWRFHRRSNDDDTGHQFSFIFYSSSEVADEIYRSLKDDSLLKEMKVQGIIVEDIYDDTSKIEKPSVEDTSDNRWSLEIKKSWPYFIMGACKMWVNLIAEMIGETKKQEQSLPEILASYQHVNEEITDLWQREGCHSLLHHLNAIFGYTPVVVHNTLVRF